jgi:hypothetical protein
MLEYVMLFRAEIPARDQSRSNHAVEVVAQALLIARPRADSSQ